MRAEQLSLKGEKKINEELGRQVTVRVMQSAAPNECEKYKLLVEETDKITSLLLGLSGRLARTENSLQVAIMLSPQGETEEKVSYGNKSMINVHYYYLQNNIYMNIIFLFRNSFSPNETNLLSNYLKPRN